MHFKCVYKPIQVALQNKTSYLYTHVSRAMRSVLKAEYTSYVYKKCNLMKQGLDFFSKINSASTGENSGDSV